METPIERNETNSVLIKDIVICVARTDNGPAIHSTFSSRQEMVNIMTNVNMEICAKIMAHDMKERAEKSRIAKPNVGIIGAARRGLFRK